MTWWISRSDAGHRVIKHTKPKLSCDAREHIIPLAYAATLHLEHACGETAHLTPAGGYNARICSQRSVEDDIARGYHRTLVRCHQAVRAILFDEQRRTLVHGYR